MGIYDRDYYRDEPRSWPTIGGSMVSTLIAINVVIFLADIVADGKLSTQLLALHGGLFRTQWQVWELVTYGFAHDPNNVMHILLNMFALFIFGRDVEAIYGPAEFLRVYLTTIVVAGLVWLLTEGYWDPRSVMIGASGAVMGVMMIYVMHYPRRTFLLSFIIPVPAWLLMALYVVLDLMGAMQQQDNVAHMAHLAGVAYGFLYYRFGWNLGRLSTPGWLSRRLPRGPKLKVHPEAPEESLEGEVDAILEKIGRQGEASLTARERATLAEASRRYQQRHQKK